MSRAASPEFASGAGLPSRRQTVTGSRHAISAGHHLAAAAGFAILEAGGNAVDAGCGAGIALTVLHSNEANFAGIAPIMIRTAAGHVVTIDGVGGWPAGFPPDLFMREHDGQSPPGILQTVVPGGPSAWLTALRDYGTMTFGEIASAAISLARDGFPVFPYFAEHVASHAQDYARFPSNAAIFLPDGRPPRVGDRFVQRDLASLLQQLAGAEAAVSKRGRKLGLDAAHDAFYRGDVATTIAKFHALNGSYLTASDLASYRCRYEEPVRARWRDFEIVTAGAWCQGPVLLQCLRMLERGQPRLAGLEHNSGRYAHLLIEVMKAAFVDRECHYGDPRFVDVDLDDLLSDAHADQWLAMLSDESVAIDLENGTAFDATQSERDRAPVPHAPDTSYVCVVDRWGNTFSAVPSDSTFVGPVVPGTGVVVSTRGVQSRPDPSHPSGIAPGKRPRLTPNPAMAIRDDGSSFVFGCPGGDVQIQAMLQVFLNAFHFGMDIQDAISAPRFSTWSFPNSFAPFQHLRGRVAVEENMEETAITHLASLGHDVEQWPAFHRNFAAVEAIYSDRESGFLRSGADPRQPAYAIAA